MSGGGYTPLFSSIVFSTIWRESNETRLVWVTMLALADARGVVEASIPGLADAAKVPLEKCKEALEILKAPDEYSRTKDHDGRRIEEIDGGWKLLNIAKFREKCRNRADYMREYMSDKRKKKDVNLLADVSRSLPEFTDSDSDSDINKDKAEAEEGKSSAAAGIKSEIQKPKPAEKTGLGKYGTWIARLQATRQEFRRVKDISWHAVLSIAADRMELVELAVKEFEANVSNMVNFSGNPCRLFQGYLIRTMKAKMRPSELYEFCTTHKLDRAMFQAKD